MNLSIAKKDGGILITYKGDEYFLKTLFTLHTSVGIMTADVTEAVINSIYNEARRHESWQLKT